MYYPLAFACKNDEGHRVRSQVRSIWQKPRHSTVDRRLKLARRFPSSCSEVTRRYDRAALPELACVTPASASAAVIRALMLKLFQPGAVGSFNMFLRNFARAVIVPRRSSTYVVDRRSLSTPPPSRHHNQPVGRKFGRRFAYVAVSLGAVWFLDQTFNASAVGRNFRTLWAVSVHSWTRASIRSPRWFWNQRAFIRWCPLQNCAFDEWCIACDDHVWRRARFHFTLPSHDAPLVHTLLCFVLVRHDIPRLQAQLST